MSMINMFLQKRKLHESQHGIVMVIAAYALSVLMLIMGSDVFYNIDSEAAGTSKTLEEETQYSEATNDKTMQSNEVTQSNEAAQSNKAVQRDKTVQSDKIVQYERIGELPGLAAINIPAVLANSKLPGGTAKATQTGLGADKAESAHTIWLLGSAMDESEYQAMLQQVAYLDPVKQALSTKAVTADQGSSKTEKAAAAAKASQSKEDEIFSLSAEETSEAGAINATKEEVSMLERIVQAEAGGEDMKGKILIANVVMNRIEDEDFPDTIEDVIFQNKDGEYQFSPVEDQRYYSVKISKGTKEAVKRALEGEDYSKGALYFIARKKTNAESAAWFDNNLKWLFKHGGHEFYK